MNDPLDFYVSEKTVHIYLSLELISFYLEAQSTVPTVLTYSRGFQEDNSGKSMTFYVILFRTFTRDAQYFRR